MKMDDGSMKMDHCCMAGMGKIVHESVVDGVKETFKIMNMKSNMMKRRGLIT